MQKILVVCLGNICRSPLAEGILLKLISENNLEMEVDSAGTSGFHSGEGPDLRTIANAGKHGIDLSMLRARQFEVSDFEYFDRIFVMDKNNLSNVLQIAPNEKSKRKVDLLLNLISPGENQEVPDPYYGGERGFELVFGLINAACKKLIDELSRKD